MPKNEFDFDDPMELNGIGLVTDEDTTDAMTECLIEEFMRLGYNHKQILALFRNPHYLSMNMVLEKRGEPFVCDYISEVFARWGRVVTWPTPCSIRREEAQISATAVAGHEEPSFLASAAAIEPDHSDTDPMGEKVPKLNL